MEIILGVPIFECSWCISHSASGRGDNLYIPVAFGLISAEKFFSLLDIYLICVALKLFLASARENKRHQIRLGF